ncbi:MAG: diaminobutyrate acetyltransferase [Desulfobacterales bacterium]
MLSAEQHSPKTGIVFRNPTTDDGKHFWEIAKASKTLDVNSMYHYLILCRHFGRTSIAAEKDGRIVGFVTAYIPPENPNTVFVWQVAVDEAERGQAIGVNMLVNVCRNAKAYAVDHLEATVTPSNEPSKRLFAAAARRLNAPFEFEKEIFSAADFGPAVHEPELLFRIGPFDDHIR